MLHVFFMIKKLNIKMLNYPILTSLDANCLLKLVRLLQRRKHLRKMLSPNKLKLLTVDEEVLVERHKDALLAEKRDRQTESILGELQV